MNLSPRRNPETKFIRTEDGKSMVYIPERGRVKRLNRTGTAILQLCDGEHSVDSIVAEVTAQYEGTGEPDVKGDVNDYIHLLKREGILHE